MKLDHTRQHYFFELQRKQQLSSGLNLPVAVLTGLLGLTAFYLRSDAYRVGQHSEIVSALLGLAVALCVFGFAFLVRSFIPGKYKELGDLSDYLAFEKDVEKYAGDYPESMPEPQAWLENELTSAYARLADLSQDENIRRAANLFRCKVSLAVAAVFLGAASIPYALYSSEGHPSMEVQENQPTNPTPPPPPRPPADKDTRDGGIPTPKPR